VAGSEEEAAGVGETLLFKKEDERLAGGLVPAMPSTHAHGVVSDARAKAGDSGVDHEVVEEVVAFLAGEVQAVVEVSTLRIGPVVRVGGGAMETVGRHEPPCRAGDARAIHHGAGGDVLQAPGPLEVPGLDALVEFPSFVEDGYEDGLAEVADCGALRLALARREGGQSEREEEGEKGRWGDAESHGVRVAGRERRGQR
jgi:hypothetical protein